MKPIDAMKIHHTTNDYVGQRDAFRMGMSFVLVGCEEIE